MTGRGRSRVEIEEEIKEIETRKKVVKKRTWTVCYSLPVNRKIWKMLRIRATDEKEAWTETVCRLKKEGSDEGAELVYARTTD